jgi:hypothetical protein
MNRSQEVSRPHLDPAMGKEVGGREQEDGEEGGE